MRQESWVQLLLFPVICALYYNVQRVPALRAFWDLEKTVLHEILVSGTVLRLLDEKNQTSRKDSIVFNIISRKRNRGEAIFGVSQAKTILILCCGVIASFAHRRAKTRKKRDTTYLTATITSYRVSCH